MKAPTNIYRTQLINMLKYLKSYGVLSQADYYKLYPTSTETPKFYGLPKVHKQSCPLRPIVACRGSIMYAIAHFMADILCQLVGQTQHHLHNSVDLVKKLTLFKLDEDESIISFDVSALFTSVLVNESLTLIEELLEADSALSECTSLLSQQVTDLLKMCLTTTYFKYDGDYYAQIEEGEMGLPGSYIVCNLLWNGLK